MELLVDRAGEPRMIKNCKKRGEWAELVFAMRAIERGLHLGGLGESRPVMTLRWIRESGLCGCR